MTDDLHDCPARGCRQRIPFDQMACRRHWAILPPELRRRVSRAWRSGVIRDVLAVRAEVERALWT